jgi:hypothetical protein
MAPHEKTERRSMNAFTTVRPRGKDQPSKAPKRNVPGAAFSLGNQAMFIKPSLPNICIESREQAQASRDKRNALMKGGI